jgi:hypothetical protein
MGNAPSLEADQEAVGGNKETYSVKCHCGIVRGKFRANKEHVVAWDCNCSDCSMRGNVHIVVPQEDFRLDMPKNTSFQDETTEYLWGTKTAKRRFCSTCGILPWYRPRSNPDGYGITLKCIDWGDDETKRPMVEIKTFDGQNWEKQFATSDISNYSKC